MARLPAPLEWLWALLFVGAHTLVPFGSCLLAVLVYPFVGTWNPRLFLKINNWIADAAWRYYGGFAIEKWGGARYHFYGDKIPMRENTITVVNHLTLLDWAFLFSVAGRRGRLGVLKFFVKKIVQYVPGFGWGLLFLDTLFVARNWTADSKLIFETFARLKERKNPFWVVSFLEGTRLTPQKLAQSQEYAKKKDLPVLKNLLIPRTKGFIATVQCLRDEVDAVYDITYAYEGNKLPGIMDVCMRRLPPLHFHIRRFPIKDLPTGEKELADWCMNLWVEKDALLEGFKKTSSFPNPLGPEEWSQPYKHEYMKLNF